MSRGKECQKVVSAEVVNSQLNKLASPPKHATSSDKLIKAMCTSCLRKSISQIRYVLAEHEYHCILEVHRQQKATSDKPHK